MYAYQVNNLFKTHFEILDLFPSRFVNRIKKLVIRIVSSLYSPNPQEVKGVFKNEY